MRKKNDITNNKLLQEYVNRMNEAYEAQIMTQQLYDDDKLTDEYFDYNKSLKFTRLWNVLNDLDVYDRNILLLFNACDRRYKVMLEELGGYKNDATLRVMVSKSRKKLKELYKEKYGDN